MVGSQQVKRFCASYGQRIRGGGGGGGGMILVGQSDNMTYSMCASGFTDPVLLFTLLVKKT